MCNYNGMYKENLLLNVSRDLCLTYTPSDFPLHIENVAGEARFSTSWTGIILQTYNRRVKTDIYSKMDMQISYLD